MGQAVFIQRHFKGVNGMKANSDNRPETFVKSRNKLFFNFNIIESEKTDEHGTRTVFDYDSVEVENQDRDSIIKAIIRDRYSIDDEIALINNKFKAADKEDPEHDAYQAFRYDVKQIAITALEPKVIEK